MAGARTAALLVVLFLGAEPAAAADFKQQRDQGIEYFRRKMYAAAVQTLAKASADRDGAQDFKTWYYLAKANHELVDLEEAFPAARTAVKLAHTDSSKRSAQALLKRMDDFFAGVEIRQAADQRGQVDLGYIHLEDKGGLINTTKKEAFARIRQRFRTKKVRLPTTIYLPFGSYTANLAPFDIKVGERASAETYLYLPDDEKGGISAWWYIGGGAVAVAGATAAAVILTEEPPPPRRRVQPPIFGEPPR